MPLTDPADLPSLDFVFGQNTRLMKVFKLANVTSVVPVMLLPKQVLINDNDTFKGIGGGTATYILGALAQKGLPQRTFSEKLPDFVDAHFGCIEDAPIAVLTVIMARNTVTTMPYYSPLQLLQLLEEVNPHLKVLDLLESSGDELLEMIEEHVAFRPLLQRLRGDLSDLNWRLSYWDPDFHVGLLKDAPRRGHLSLVHSR